MYHKSNLGSIIGGILYFGFFISGFLFTIGLCIYEICIGNWKFFKEEPEVFFILGFIIFLFIVIKEPFKKKDKVIKD